MKKIGEIEFGELPGDIQADVVAVVSEKTGEDDEEVLVGLKNGPSILPLVLARTARLFSRKRSVSEPHVKRLREVLEDSTEWPFPPVVIDSDRKKDILLEGGHRTKAAYQSDWPAIPAIDIAGARVIKTTEGLETYDFKRKRWKRVY